MGRTILCQNCKSTFDEDILKKKNSEDICPVCGESLLAKSENDGSSSNDESLSFGEGIELGENDSFDEDKIDFWWYEIIKPGEVWKGITFADGDVSVNCAKCGHFVGSVPYPIARTGNYLLIEPRFHDRCSHCGNELKNHILSKRPTDWVDPRKREMWVTDWEHLPKCPICSSTKIKKISMTNKAASVVAFGVLAAGHVSKTYKCETCGAKF